MPPTSEKNSLYPGKKTLDEFLKWAESELDQTNSEGPPVVEEQTGPPKPETQTANTNAMVQKLINAGAEDRIYRRFQYLLNQTEVEEQPVPETLKQIADTCEDLSVLDESDIERSKATILNLKHTAILLSQVHLQLTYWTHVVVRSLELEFVEDEMISPTETFPLLYNSDIKAKLYSNNDTLRKLYAETITLLGYSSSSNVLTAPTPELDDIGLFLDVAQEAEFRVRRSLGFFRETARFKDNHENSNHAHQVLSTPRASSNQEPFLCTAVDTSKTIVPNSIYDDTQEHAYALDFQLQNGTLYVREIVDIGDELFAQTGQQLQSTAISTESYDTGEFVTAHSEPITRRGTDAFMHFPDIETFYELMALQTPDPHDHTLETVHRDQLLTAVIADHHPRPRSTPTKTLFLYGADIRWETLLASKAPCTFLLAQAPLE